MLVFMLYYSHKNAPAESNARSGVIFVLLRVERRSNSLAYQQRAFFC